MTFKKGQSGNPGGRGSDKLFRQALMLSLKEADGDLQKMRRVTDALVTKAIEGNVHAIGLIADRVDGKLGSDAASPEDEREAIFGRSVSAAQRIIARITASRPNTEDRDAHSESIKLTKSSVEQPG